MSPAETASNAGTDAPPIAKTGLTLGIARRDGIFAEFTTLPLANLHRVPASVPDEMAVFTEPLAAALEIQQQVHVQPYGPGTGHRGGPLGTIDRPDPGADGL